MRATLGTWVELLLEHRLLLLAGAILLGYAWSLWALLRRESSTARLVLLLLCMCAFALRVVAFSAFPPGMNEDEPKVLACSLDALKNKVVHTESCSGLPFLLTVLFQAQLVPWIGPNRPSMRFYSILTGTLSVAAAYGAARALQMGVLAALSFAALVASLPWSLFYGRIAFGAQLTLHEFTNCCCSPGSRELYSGPGALVQRSWPDLGKRCFCTTILQAVCFCRFRS